MLWFCTTSHRLTYWLNRWFYLTGWLLQFCTSQFPSCGGWQASPDGVVVAVLHQSIPLLWRGGRPKHFAMHAFSNHVVVLHNVTPIDLLAQSVVLSDGVVVAVLYQSIPLLWRGGRPKHFAMHAFSNHVVVLHNVTPIDLLAQSVVLSDGVVAAVLHQSIPLLWRGVRLRLTGWLRRVCARSFPSCGGVSGFA